MATQITSKRILKLIISAAFFCGSYLWNLLRRLGGKAAPGTCVVLYYHGVPAENREQFARQMDTLIRWAKPISADFKEPLTLGARYAVVTFDDGVESLAENALPELKKRKIPATVFISTEALGGFFGPEGCAEKVMSVGQLRRLPSGLVSVGSHTMTHPLLPSMTEAEARREISGSRAKLEEILNKRITLFSFPYGAFNQRLVECCREAGYERVFTTLPTLAFSDSREFATGRVRVDPTDWTLEFCLKLCGAYRWLPFAFALKRKLFGNPQGAPQMRRDLKADEKRALI